MTLLQLQPPVNSWQWDAQFQPGPVCAVPQPTPTTPAHPAPRISLLQFQLKRLIDDLLAQPDLDVETRIGLLVHVAENPGRPEHALLAHLRDLLDAEDLPPYEACRRPGSRTAGS
ncbi:hypothetical protein ACFRAU_08035 [Arthrobacter sp. NPDC056691]|uniref:hypothetical protein n=1 Tax=Arthrobacter sp. NPDC056691 TaxID=3345913 RepID=UPI003670616A